MRLSPLLRGFADFVPSVVRLYFSSVFDNSLFLFKPAFPHRQLFPVLGLWIFLQAQLPLYLFTFQLQTHAHTSTFIEQLIAMALADKTRDWASTPITVLSHHLDYKLLQICRFKFLYVYYHTVDYMKSRSRHSAASNFLYWRSSYLHVELNSLHRLSYLNGDFARWGCSYKIRLLLEQNGNTLSDYKLKHSLDKLFFIHDFWHVWPTDKSNRKICEWEQLYWELCCVDMHLGFTFF